MKIAIYARVSMEEKDESKRQFQNPENQIQPLQDFAKVMNWEILPEHIFIDRASGANPAREKFREMMTMAMQRRFSGILIWAADRFSREGTLQMLSYIKQLRDRGIWLRSLTESWLDTTQGGFTDNLFGIMAWCAAEERKKISERTKAGITRLKAQGKWKGGRPKKGGTDLPPQE